MSDDAMPPGAGLVWDLPEPAGRSGGPALSRATITRAALEIADADGVAAVTMRRVAAALGSSTPMSLYRYVGGKPGIHDLMLDAVIGEVGLPDEPPAGWRDGMRLAAGRVRVVVRAHPWYVALSHHRPMFGPNALRHNEWMLTALDGHGLSAGTAMSVAGMVGGYALAFAGGEAEENRMRRRTGLRSESELRAAGAPYVERIVADGRYPRLAAWLTGGLPPEPDEQFELGLECLLDGIGRRIIR